MPQVLCRLRAHGPTGVSGAREARGPPSRAGPRGAAEGPSRCLADDFLIKKKQNRQKDSVIK